MEIKINDLPHIAKSSRKIRGNRSAEKLDWLESRHFDVILTMTLVLVGWVVGGVNSGKLFLSRVANGEFADFE